MTKVDTLREAKITKIDTQDPRYQVSDYHKPDKENTWPYPAKNDRWVHAHNALRGEMSNTREALEAVKSRGKPLTDWEINSIKLSASGHIEHVHSHHT